MGKKYKIGYVQGTFDLFHIGHLNLLKRAKESCEYLIAGVVSDELNYAYKGMYPYIPYIERSAIVAAIQYVDQVEKIDFSNEDKLKTWERYHYDCHFSGDDHRGEWDTLTKAFQERGTDIVFFPYTEETSSTKIKNLVKAKILYEQDTFFSFDVFDTLITRKTATPKGIFALMQKRLSIEYSDGFPKRMLDHFYDLRIYYERAARHEFSYQQDITLDDIYQMFLNYEELTLEQKNILIELELQIETENIIGIEKNIAQIKTLENAGRRVVLISDMYLSGIAVRKLLVKADRELEHLPIYVSADYKKTKSSSDLYKIVQQKEDRKFSQWVHTGDNNFSDIKAAKILGIQTIHDKTTALSIREKLILQKREQDLDIQLFLGQCKLDRLYGINNKMSEFKIEQLLLDVKSDDGDLMNAFPIGILKHRIVIYGAGKFGQKFYQYLIKHTDLEYIGWVDKNYKQKQKDGLPVTSVESLQTIEFDQIVIAVTELSVAEEIEKFLLNMGIEKRKILCIV